ncbi:MAG: ATP-binding protein [Polyangiaceae bacterium]|nr:ATP-binding protein [Polyangiaceae bacterium]
MWIERELAASLVGLAQTFPVVVLVGPRQVGKTALLERTFPHYRYASLDVGELGEMAETRPDDFLERFPPPVVLDEIQYAPAFFRAIKTAVDRRRAERGLFVLTGSQNFTLMKSVADSLAGRSAVVPFLGLSGREWAAAPGFVEQHGFRELVWRGSFPGLWAEGTPARDRWYQGYVASYLERDVRNLLRVGSLRDFERFLRACALRCGQLLNMSELGRDVGISPTTAREWVSVLVASNLILLLEPYHRSLGKRLVKSPKLYFTDTGLAAYLMGLQSADAAWASPQAGALFETHVVGQWHRWRDWHAPAAGLWFWQDRSGNEVDLLIELDARLVALECKLGSRPTAHDARGIAKLRAFYGADQVSAAFVACTADAPHEIADGVVARSGFTSWEVQPNTKAGGSSRRR